MSLQLEILSDTVHRERMHALSPSDDKRRSAARLLEALQCCTGTSWSSRLRAALDGPAAGCCAAA